MGRDVKIRKKDLDAYFENQHVVIWGQGFEIHKDPSNAKEWLLRVLTELSEVREESPFKKGDRVRFGATSSPWAGDMVWIRGTVLECRGSKTLVQWDDLDYTVWNANDWIQHA